MDANDLAFLIGLIMLALFLGYTMFLYSRTHRLQGEVDELRAENACLRQRLDDLTAEVRFSLTGEIAVIEDEGRIGE